MKRHYQNLTLAALLATTLSSYSTAGQLEDGDGLFKQKNFAGALSLWRPLANQGNAEAQYRIGDIYFSGMSVAQDYNEAAKWYMNAARQGNSPAISALNLMYSEGVSAQNNGEHHSAYRLWRPLADLGYARAQCSLGLLYYRGLGVPQNYTEAVKWYRRSAHQGDAAAQYNLGIMYAQGRGVAQDHEEAAKWNRKAANQGDPDAQAKLGIAYSRGNGVPKDEVQAYMWLNLAAAGNHQYLKSRDEIEKQLKPAQLAEGQKLSRNWKTKGSI